SRLRNFRTVGRAVRLSTGRTRPLRRVPVCWVLGGRGCCRAARPWTDRGQRGGKGVIKRQGPPKPIRSRRARGCRPYESRSERKQPRRHARSLERRRRGGAVYWFALHRLAERTRSERVARSWRSSASGS